MSSLLQLGLIFGGPVLVFVTKNKRWWILTLLGLAWTALDILLITASLMG
jgi:hypothetical protein